MNRFRETHRPLSDREQQRLTDLKHRAKIIADELEFAADTERDVDERCIAIALTKLEEAVMWAVKGLTA